MVVFCFNTEQNLLCCVTTYIVVYLSQDDRIWAFVPPSTRIKKTELLKMEKTLYEILEVSPTASIEAIRGAYKFLTQKWHPDRNPLNREDAERITKLLTASYQILSNSDRRLAYDMSLKSARRLHQSTATGAQEPSGASKGTESPSYRTPKSNSESAPYADLRPVEVRRTGDAVAPTLDVSALRADAIRKARSDAIKKAVSRTDARTGRSSRGLSSSMSGCLFFFIVLGAVLGIGGSAFLDWVHRIDREDEERSSKYEKQQSTGLERCVSTIRSRIAPAQILDVSFGIGGEFGGNLRRTTTGYATPVSVDIGGRLIDFECYLDANYNVLSVESINKLGTIP